MKNVAIEMKHVSRKFVSPTGKITLALRDFSLTVHEGDFIAIVGPTGCGKSTTLGMITGLNPPSSGSVKVFGKSVQGIDPNIGFVFQADAVFPWKSVIDNVAIGPIFRGTDPKIANDMAADWIRRVGLSGFEHHYPHQLSGGMRKRVALAQTFINEPKILLMDEPFSALDVQTRALMQEELLGLWSEKKASVIFVTHDIEEAIALADRVIVLSKGPGSVKSSYEIPLARPRDISEARYSDEFVHLSKQIWSDLKDEVQI
ncbi:ABC transporter ATP-binding protein [Undibacterium oligocarboniphilum]|uniref:ABC transporter ATP-binding protein n=1 Tax=Undibacterium oligocarboniphilum TaxID=666702 RepID=A0A850QA19_9BURK|nr:ABC transporter ATP-binding protein [Undibacterium oligocarboniphilum]MBC3870976.1 ABC transporter ATP-binding protein [Undibacterium oligocarboniphilum]NVO76401.1 ABC transporter ATP-binding protein [Undibacterium oligocarboniphilum]